MGSATLPRTLAGGPSPRHGPGVARTRDWPRIGLALVTATLAWNVVEAGVALASGLRADSIALLGFGLDSGIECAAAGVLLWRLRLETRGADPETLERAEVRVHRFVGAPSWPWPPGSRSRPPPPCGPATPRRPAPWASPWPRPPWW